MTTVRGDHMGRPLLPARGSETRDFDRRVRQIVAAMLVDGSPRVHRVAGSVRTSARTLQRRLQGAGLTYAGVVQQVRFEVASQMLRDPARKIGTSHARSDTPIRPTSRAPSSAGPV